MALRRSNEHHIIPPERRGGFQDWWAYENRNSPFDNYFHGNLRDGTNSINGEERVTEYEPDAITDRLIHYCQQQAEQKQSFFAVASSQRPHDPYTAPAEYMQRFQPANITLPPNVPPHLQKHAQRDLAGYYAAIENIDWNIGRLRKALEEMGIADNTWLVFFSDHGDMHGSHGHWRKSTPHEESIRIPCIFGMFRPFNNGTKLRKHIHSSQQICAWDIAPTTLGACGLETPEYMRGHDYSGELRYDRPQHQHPDSVFLQQCHAKTFQCYEGTWRGVVSNDGWKYVANEKTPLLLFNLNNDPHEQYNLVHIMDHEYQQQRARLHARLQQWLKDSNDSYQLCALP